jgi:hypothetical protein
MVAAVGKVVVVDMVVVSVGFVQVQVAEGRFA